MRIYANLLTAICMRRHGVAIIPLQGDGCAVVHTWTDWGMGQRPMVGNWGNVLAHGLDERHDFGNAIRIAGTLATAPNSRPWQLVLAPQDACQVSVLETWVNAHSRFLGRRTRP